ncbi:3-dehydroquinate synthase family protein [Acidobacteriota bacterium]
MKDYLEYEKNVVIIDSNVRGFHGHHFSDFDSIEIDPGEQNKTLETVERIYRNFLEWELDQSSCVIAIGGGIVCDLAGFAASTYNSGINFGFIPSTLIAQIDVSIGEKNGINFHGNNNLITVFNHPQFVLCDIDFLDTLPERELASGFAELIKYSLIKSASLFEFLEQEWEALLKLKKDTLEKVINDSVIIKSWIIQSDSLEIGERSTLHFGNTLAHTIVKDKQKSRGEAVSLGMVLASKISAQRNMITQEEVEHITVLLKKLKLPTEISSSREILLNSIKEDKNRYGENIQFVLLSEIGKAEVVPMTYTELEAHVKDLY